MFQFSCKYFNVLLHYFESSQKTGQPQKPSTDCKINPKGNHWNCKTWAGQWNMNTKEGMGWEQQGRRKSLNLSQCIISIPPGILFKKVEFNLHCLWISSIISKNFCLTYAFLPDSWQSYFTDSVLVKYPLGECAFINNPFPSYCNCNTFLGHNLGMCNIKVTLGNWSWLMAAESGLMLLPGHPISCLLLCGFFLK